LLRFDEIEEMLRLVEVRCCRAVLQQQPADAFETEAVVDEVEDLGLVAQAADVHLAMDFPELLAAERNLRMELQSARQREQSQARVADLPVADPAQSMFEHA